MTGSIYNRQTIKFTHELILYVINMVLITMATNCKDAQTECIILFHTLNRPYKRTLTGYGCDNPDGPVFGAKKLMRPTPNALHSVLQ